MHALPSDVVFAQVYGGTASIIIGSVSGVNFNDDGMRLREFYAQSGDTYCSGCTVNVSDVAIINSVAVSNTTGKLCAAFRLLQRLCSARNCVCLLQLLPHKPA